MMEQHAFPVIDLRATGANILRLRKERGPTFKPISGLKRRRPFTAGKAA